MIFPISKSCHKIIKQVYNSNGIKISRLLKETSVSQKIGYKHIDELTKMDIFNSESIGSLRIIKPNLQSETGKLIYGLIEKEKELELIKAKPAVKQAISKLRQGTAKLLIESAVIIGSFVKNHSDDRIEILVIAETNDKAILPFLQECFYGIENAVIARILSKNGFLKLRQSKKDLYNELFKNHVCIYNTQGFLRLIA